MADFVNLLVKTAGLEKNKLCLSVELIDKLCLSVDFPLKKFSVGHGGHGCANLF